MSDLHLAAPRLGRVHWPASLRRASGLIFNPATGALMVTPALLVLTLMNLVPILWSLGMSFFRYRADRPHTPPRFVGLGNYVYALLHEDVWEDVQHTAVLMGVSVLLQVAIGALLAMVFYRPFPGRRVVMMLVLTPMLLSTVAVGTFFNLFYDPTFGLVSAVVRPFTGQPFAPLATPASAMLSLIVADAWMWSPFVMLMLLAGLASIPPHLLEAAQIDRATTWRRFRAVILPSLRGVLLLAVLFRLIQSFNQFDLVYTITNGGPGTSTETLATEIYGNAFVLFETGRASALATFATFAIIVLVRLYFQALRQWEPSYAEAAAAARAERAERTGPRPVVVLSRRARWSVVLVAMPLAALAVAGAPYLLIHYRVYPRLLVFPPAPGTTAAVQGWSGLETAPVASADFPTATDGFGWITPAAAAPAVLAAELDAAQAPPLRTGQAAEIRAPQIADRAFAARLIEVAAPAAGAGRLVLRFAVEDPDHVLKPGMLARFHLLDVPAASSALAVPVSAVIYENDGVRVWVIGEDNVPAPRAVTIGRIGGGMVEVRDGLQAGEQVVTRGGLFLDRAWKGF